MARRILSGLALSALLLCAAIAPVRAETLVEPARFYNYKGGMYLHRNPYCDTVAKKYLPLRALTDDAMGRVIQRNLGICPRCGTPPTAQRPPDPLATVLDIPYGMDYEACKSLVAQRKEVALDKEYTQSNDGYTFFTTTPRANFLLMGTHPDSLGFFFTMGKLESTGAQYRAQNARQSADKELDELLPTFFSLLFQLEATYGAPTNGGLNIGDAFPYAQYNYPMANGERDAARIMRLLRESPAKLIRVFEVFGNVSVVINLEHYVEDGSSKASGVVSLLSANRNDLPEGSLAPFVWPNGDYAE